VRTHDQVGSADDPIHDSLAVASAVGAVELVIFDCDGVLVDTEEIGARISAEALTRLGWALTPQDALDRFLGCTEEYFAEQAALHLGRPLPPGWDDTIEALCDAAYATELKPVRGVEAVLDELDALVVPTCVASNGSHAKMRRTLGATGLYDRFDGRIFSAEDVVNGKPAPDLYLHAARTSGAAPGRCVVVEDSPRGVEAARAAGMACIGYAGLTPAARLAGPGVTVCETMAAVLGQLRSLLLRPIERRVTPVDWP
jgi:HAD superfamily hydrolase (TIGR01509 family)